MLLESFVAEWKHGGVSSPPRSMSIFFRSGGSFAGTAPSSPLGRKSGAGNERKSLLQNQDRKTYSIGSGVKSAQDVVVKREGVLKKKSSSMMATWSSKSVRLYRTCLMFSEPGGWKPRDQDLINLLHIVTLNMKKDGEFDIVENSGGKTSTIKFKATSDVEAQEWMEAIAETKAHIEVANKSEEHGMSPNLCNQIPAKEIQRLFKEFALHDKDGSGFIDTNEFRDMCRNLGVELTQEQTDEAMKELDRDGNGSCDFEEIMWFWSKTPEMGGHTSLGLQFLQAKLKATSHLENVREALDQRLVALNEQVDESDDMTLKFGYALNPSTTSAAEAKMAVTTTLSKEPEVYSPDGRMSCLVRLQADPASEATRVGAELQALISTNSEVLDMYIGSASVSVEEDGVILLAFKLEAELAARVMNSEEAQCAVPNSILLLVNWFKKCELSLSLNFDFDDMLATPDKRLDLETILRHKFSVDMVMCPQMKRLVLGMIPAVSAWPSVAWKLFGGCQGDLQLAFDSSQADPILNSVTGGLSDVILEYLKPAKLQEVFSQNLAQLTDDMKADLVRLHALMADINAIHSVAIDGLPDPEVTALSPSSSPASWKQMSFQLENCNPFPLMRYIFSPCASDSNTGGAPARTTKPLAPAERTRLKAVFEKFDADSSGSLDLKEVSDMIKELGGTLTEEATADALKELDTDANGTVDFDEFVTWWSSTPGCGGYSSAALEMMKLQISNQEGFGGLKKKFLNIFPSKGDSGLTLNASCECAPGMGVIESAKAAMKALLRKAGQSAGWLSSATPCMEITLSVANAAKASEVAAALQTALDALSELVNLVFPNGKWTCQVGPVGKDSMATVNITAELTDVMQSVTEDPQFVQVANQLFDNIEQMEFGITSAAGFDDLLENPAIPVVGLLSGLKVSTNSQFTTEGKVLLERACSQSFPSLIPLLKLLVGVDFKALLGYHEQYLYEAIMEGDSKSAPAVQWFTVDDVKFGLQRALQGKTEGAGAEDVAKATAAVKDVIDQLLGIHAISFKNLPLCSGDQKKDLVFSCDQFDVVPLLAYIFGIPYEGPPETAESPTSPNGEATSPNGGKKVVKKKVVAKKKAAPKKAAAAESPTSPNADAQSPGSGKKSC